MSNAPCIRCGYGFGESDSCRIHNEAEARIEAERDAALARVKELESDVSDSFVSVCRERDGMRARIAELEGALREVLKHYQAAPAKEQPADSLFARLYAVLEGKK